MSSRPAPRRHQLPAGTGEPEIPRRGAAYVRESSEEQGEGFSPGAQRQKIREWAEQAGIEIVAEYCDLQKDGRVVAVKPHAAFAGYFTSLQAAEEKPPKGGLKSEVTTAGATGVAPGLCAPS